MPDPFDIPDISLGEQPADFAVALRIRVFASQREAERSLGLASGTVNKYEREKVLPPLGYLAALMRLMGEKEQNKRATDSRISELQHHLLQQIKKLLEYFSEEYRYRASFPDWDHLCQAADAYLEEHKIPDPSPKSRATPPVPTDTPSNRSNGPFLVPQLPVQGVFGRETDLNEISELLALEHPEETNVPALALRGMGGIGKTTLARAIGHLAGLRERFSDGILWVELGPSPVVRLLLNDLGRALDIDLLPERDEAACQTRLQNILYNRRVVLIVDDVWEIAHGKYFQIGGPHCRLVFTTREPPIAYTLATRERTKRVDVLSAAASLALLRKLAPEAVAADEKRAGLLCERLEFLPLALQLAGRLLANETDVPARMSRLVDGLAEQRQARLTLLQAEGRLGLDEETPVTLQAVLGMSVERLPPLDKDRFAMLAVFGGEPLTWEINAAASVWECSPQQAENTTARFIQRGLVERQGDRYWIHALLADYAAELMEAAGL